MNDLSPIVEASSLPALVDRASQALAGARGSAEVLEARDMASFAYDIAKRTARLEKAKDAHDSLVAAAHRAQADALEIEAKAKRRLADEYDAAQERGEVRAPRERTTSKPEAVGPSELGLTHKAIHEARQIRDAEAADPGIVRRTLDERLDAGEEPTRTALRQAVVEASLRGLRPERASPADRRNPIYEPNPAYDAMCRVTGACNAINEKFDEYAMEFIAAGFVDNAQKRREAKVVREAIKNLTTFVEMIDAE